MREDARSNRAAGAIAPARRLLAGMIFAVAAVTAGAWWDSRRESEAVLRDVAREQSVLASMAARDVRAHLDELARTRAGSTARVDPSAETSGEDAFVVDPPSADAAAGRSGAFVVPISLEDGRSIHVTLTAAALLGDLPPLESPGEFCVLLAPPATAYLYGTNSPGVASAVLRAGLNGGLETVRLTRADASALGLLARTAMAGLAYIDAGPLGRWGVVAIGTAAHQRDREARAFWRFVLGVAVASALVLTFGGAAVRSQRRKLEAERELAVAGLIRERNEQLGRAERVATMGTFAMGIVHEVASPLGVIVGRTEQLRAYASDDERSAHAARAILEQVDRIQLVVRRFLDMARGGPPALAKTRPRDVVRSVAASVEHRFVQAGVSLAIDAPDELPDVLCDRALLEQAIVNLLLNACDACASGGHVALTSRGDLERVTFVVTDDGAGIRPDVADRATDPFFTTKHARAGTGLGLAIASEIAKSHRGELTIAPRTGCGTRACIEIPAWARVEGGLRGGAS